MQGLENAEIVGEECCAQHARALRHGRLGVDGAQRESIPLFWCGEAFAVSHRIKDLKPAIGSPYHLKLQTVEMAK